MRLFRRSRHRHDALDVATHARERAERELEAVDRELDEVRSATPSYKAIGDSLRELREQDHFAMQIRVIFQGGNPHGQH